VERKQEQQQDLLAACPKCSYTLRATHTECARPVRVCDCQTETVCKRKTVCVCVLAASRHTLCWHLSPIGLCRPSVCASVHSTPKRPTSVPRLSSAPVCLSVCV